MHGSDEGGVIHKNMQDGAKQVHRPDEGGVRARAPLVARVSCPDACYDR